MAEWSISRYNAALLASTLSLLAWVGTGLAAVAAGYFALTDGPVGAAVWAVGGLLVVAIVFARLEKRYIES